jgi:hypothetical protein
VDSSPRGRFGWIMAHVSSAMFVAAFAYTANNMSMLFILVIVSGVAGPPLALAGSFAYPVSRRRRAIYSYLLNGASALAYVCIAGVTAAVLFTLRPWPQFMAGDPHEAQPSVWVLVAITLAWIPVTQWVQSRPPIVDIAQMATKGLRRMPAVMVTYILFTFLVGISTAAYMHPPAQVSRAALASAIVALIFATQTGLYLFLQRGYARRDLV